MEAIGERFKTTVEQYRAFHRDGYLVLRGLLPEEDVEAFRAHAMSLIADGGDDPYERFVPLHLRQAVDVARGGESALAFVDHLRARARVHMLHREDAAADAFMRHPRLLDAIEALIDGDILALQTVLLYNPPGRGGHPWHQDGRSIATSPETLLAAWIPLEPVDEENGCLRVARGSHREPVFPAVRNHGGVRHAIADLVPRPDRELIVDLGDELELMGRRYPIVPLPMAPGDVVLFGGHLMHRSTPNRSAQRWRRAFTAHYCSARSWVPWNHNVAYGGGSANACHVTVRGTGSPTC